MALSSLQAQLAALNGGGGAAGAAAHPGSTFAGSKRHEDAVGRGLLHSVHHGGGGGGQETAKFKPSLVYPTAREAADVPLSVLQETARTALGVLTNERAPGLRWFSTATTATDDGDHQLSYLSICDDARDLTPEQLHDVLLAVSVLFRDKACRQDCLHVVEYLLRRYRLAERPASSCDLLWTFWPHAEHCPALFHRVLQLVDLTADQSYVWLRPYCIVASNDQSEGEAAAAAAAGGGGTTATINLPPRSLVAQHAIKNPAWLRRLVRSTQGVARRRWTAISNSRKKSTSPVAVQRGVQHHLSWSAALVLDGLSWLSTTTTPMTMNDAAAGDREAVVRTLLPVVLAACSNNSITAKSPSISPERRDWTAWGYVVASAVAERLELAPTAVALIAGKILQGVRASPTTSRSLDDQADAVTAVLSLVIPSARQHQQPHPGTYLPLLNGKWLGCPLPKDTFEALLEGFGATALSTVLGFVYQTRRIVVAPLVATLFVTGIGCMGSSAGQADDEEDGITQCLQSLVDQEGLQSMWKDVRMDLVASLASFVLLQGVEREADERHRKGCHKILLALHKLDPASCERGIAHAIQSEEVDSCDRNKDTVRTLLQGIVETGSLESSDKTHLLPPRVALEHADPTVRLEAVARLVLAMGTKTKADVDSSMEEEEEEEEDYDDNRMGETLLESLLRRWSADENTAVALASSKALCEDGRMGSPLVDNDNSQRLGELVLSGLYHWMDKAAMQSPLSSDMQELMQNSAVIAAHTAKELSSLSGHTSKTLFQLIMEYLIAQLESKHESLVSKAAESVTFVLAKDAPSIQGETNAELVSIAKSYAVKNSPVLQSTLELYSKAVGPNPVAESYLRQHSMWIMLSEMSDSFAEGNGTPTVDLLPFCMVLLRDEHNRLEGTGLAVVQNCLGQAIASYANKASHIPDILVSLAEVQSQHLFSKVIQPALLSLVATLEDIKGNRVSPTSVLLEAAARPETPALSSERLLLLAAQVISSGDEPAPVLGLVPSLAFLKHPSARVRAASLVLLQAVGGSLDHKDWSSLSRFCTKLSEVKASTCFGATDLSNLIASCVKGSSNNNIKLLLRLCVLSAASVGRVTTSEQVNSNIFAEGWIPFDKATGGSRAAAVILEALELAGEEAFPLGLRWEEGGRVIFEQLLLNACSGAPTALLAEVIVKMLKGVTVQDPQIIISSGPRSGGGRTRTYSVGRLDGVTVIEPYPTDMVRSITKALSQRSEILAPLVVNEVLANKPWRELVFTKLSNESRRTIASEMLSYITNTAEVISDGVFFSMPLQPADLSALLESNKDNIAALSLLCDFIRMNWTRLQASPGASDMAVMLFKLLAASSTKDVGGEDENDEKDFVIQSILVALSQLWREADAGHHGMKLDKKKLKKCATTLLGLFDSNGQPPNCLLTSFQSRAAALALLARLCSDCPEHIVGSLVSILTSSMVLTGDSASIPRDVSETFSVIVPLFQVHGPSSGYSLSYLFAGFIKTAQKKPESQAAQLFQEFSKALVASHADHDSAALEVASLMAYSLAVVTHKNGGQPVPEQTVGFIVKVVDNMPPLVQMSCLQLFLEYSKSIIFWFLHESSQQGSIESTADADTFKSLPGPDEMSQVAATGAVSQKTSSSYTAIQMQHIANFVNALLQGFCDILLLDRLQKYIRRGDGDSSALSLNVWQNLLVTCTGIQHNLSSVNNDERAASIIEAARSLKESQQILQDLLPVPLFLASVSSLINDEAADAIQESALRLVANKLVEIDSNSAEAELFTELVPVITKLLQKKIGVLEDTSLHQAAILALVHIAQATGKSKDGRERVLEHFANAINVCTKLLQECECSQFKAMGHSTRQLVCSIALCCATLVKAVGTRCIPSLPTLLKLLVSALSSVNDHMSSSNECDSREKENATSDDEAQVFQLSVLRALISLIRTVPQFLPPYLPLLLKEKVVLSPSLRAASSEHSGTVTAATEQFDEALSSQIPPRVLITAASRAAEQCSSAIGLKALLSIMKASVEQTSSREAAAHRDSILKAIKIACESSAENDSLVSTSTHLLLALVLKLSEVQLRRVFAVLREWRGDLDKEDPGELSLRRYAFWTLSAALSKELGAIFLPCLSTVVSDAKAELDLAASKLTERKSIEKSSGGEKRRRIDSNGNGSVDKASLMCIQPLLLCLELSLRADASDGGNWVRSEDNQRYNLLLGPLGQLLQCHVSGAQDMIHGSASGVGNVVNCLTALASAAGNEQLWKPLNHAVLEACGNEKHSDVRRGGLICLLSLMRSLGEEYMVLLPECLPILSELLEDSEEDIASLARECVTLAEELIGESLEESLR